MTQQAPRKSLVVLEGPDGSGKTTLAEALGREGYEYAHCGAPEKPAFYYYMDGLRSTQGPTVMDRFHVGSYVYGTAFRHMDDLSDYERWTLEGTVLGQGGVMIYTCPPAHVTAKNLERGPDNEEATIYEVPEKQLEIRQLYEHFMSRRTQLPLINYDYSSAPNALEAVVANVKMLHRQFEREAMLPPDVPVVGNIVNPKYVFVADEPSTRPKILQRSRQLYPGDAAKQQRFQTGVFAMADYYNKVPFQKCTSGRYLHLTLTTADIPLTDYCIFNSRLLEGQEIAQYLGPDVFESSAPGWKNAEVVALGNEADKRLTVAGFPHRTVPHPSYWKRFHYRDIYGYAKQLKGDA